MPNKPLRSKIKKIDVAPPTQRSLIEKIANLVREEIGGAAKLVNFDCELETFEGTIRINWTPITTEVLPNETGQNTY